MVRRFDIRVPQRCGAISCHALCWYAPLNGRQVFRAIVLTQSNIVPLLRADPEGDRAADEVQDMFYTDNRQYQRDGVYDDDISLLAFMLHQYFQEMTHDHMWDGFQSIPFAFILTEGNGEEWGGIGTRVEHAIVFPDINAAFVGSQALEGTITQNGTLPIVGRGYHRGGYVDTLIRSNPALRLVPVGPVVVL